MTSPGENVLCRYRYDPLDSLISHALPDMLVRQRFYCKRKLATEIQGATHCSIIQHGDQLLAQQRGGRDAPETTLLATDLQRSVLQTLKANHPPQPITYSPYGHHLAASGLLSLLDFNGERPDSVTGHYLLGNGYRAFNPLLMRFNSPDRLSPFGKGGLNAYTYCLGDPVNRVDPMGNSALKWIQRQLGMRPIYLSDHYRPRALISTRQAENAYSRIGAIEEQIVKLQEDALVTTFQRDRTLAFAAQQTAPSPEPRAYENTRAHTKIDNPFAISDTPKTLSDATERATVMEQARYAPIFKEMNELRQSIPHNKPFFRNDILNLFERATKSMDDRALVSSYRTRLHSVSTLEIDALKTEQARIRNKYFT